MYPQKMARHDYCIFGVKIEAMKIWQPLPSMSQLQADMKQKASLGPSTTKHNSMVQRQGSLEPVHFQPLAARHRRADSWFQQAVGLSVHTPPFEHMTGLHVQT